MNVPNLLTLSRFGFAAFLLVGLFASFPFARTATLVAFVAAAATDALDGHLARVRYGVTAIGELLDPLADKVLVAAAFVGFVQLGLIPAWIVVLILAREFLVTGLRVLAAARGRRIPAGPWGKHKTAWQMVVIAVLLAGLAARDDWMPRLGGPPAAAWAPYLDAAAYVLAVAAALITVASGAVYLYDHRDLLVDARG